MGIYVTWRHTFERTEMKFCDQAQTGQVVSYKELREGPASWLLNDQVACCDDVAIFSAW